MSITCNPCEGTGFKNTHQLPDGLLDQGVDAVLAWMREHKAHDVVVCDCCGDGEGWYGKPGQHYTEQDPVGMTGPYASNGGLCKCH